MGGGGTMRSVLLLVARVVNDLVSFLVFTVLDVMDVALCIVYKLLDYAWESEWKPCYCSSSPRDMITSSGKILVSESGGSKVLSLSSTKLQLEDISDTLYSRSSLVAEVSRSTVRELRRLKSQRSIRSGGSTSTRAAANSTSTPRVTGVRSGAATTTFTINSTIIQVLQGKIGGGHKAQSIPQWSDCSCRNCTSWSRRSPATRNSLFVHAEGPKDGGGAAEEDVLFIHGFISSSKFWTETVFPEFSEAARRRYRLIAVDLLGFARSPKPADSLYTLREHVEVIERSVLEPYNVKSFHIVAHSLGSILALALAVKYPGAVKSLTLLAPPYFPVPRGEQGTQYVLRRVAPRRVWPMIAFGASIACWYEHIGRTVCLITCKYHRQWELAFKFLTRNRIRTFLMEGFFCHTHNAAWHTLHNIICGSAGKIDGYLEAVRDQLSCDVTVLHGRNDELLPVDCSYAVQLKIPRARVKVIDDRDHITIVVGRQKAFARELEEIWDNTRR